MGYMVGTNTLLLVTVQWQSHAYISHTLFYGLSTASALFSLEYIVRPPSKTTYTSYLIRPTHCSRGTCELQICDVSLCAMTKELVLRTHLASWICQRNIILTCSSSTLLSSWSISLSESSPDASWLLYSAPPLDTLYTLLIFTVRDANICR
jgi:hypothetical protein